MAYYLIEGFVGSSRSYFRELLGHDVYKFINTG